MSTHAVEPRLGLPGRHAGAPAPGSRRAGTTLARVLGALFTMMAVLQLADLTGFVAVLDTFRLGGTGVAWALAAVLLTGEVVSGLWLLFVPRYRPLGPAVVFAATSVLWSALAMQAFARGLVLPNCGCFGVYLAQPLRWWVLVQDGLLLGYSALLLRGGALEAGGR
ncbi:MAG: hypothetical protein M3257_08520 [Actinomycetota bacterium]|nr:hypothetical protein [Actinomycetota bacterium]